MNNKFILPLAVIVTGLLIGGAIYFNTYEDKENTEKPKTVESSNSVMAFDEKDHIWGNPDAEIKIVEYSDPQCRFCKKFHPTMKKIMSEFEEGGRVAWVYRHFTIFGEQSIKEANAQECAAELGGKEKFWTYLDALFEAKDENSKLPYNKSLGSIAEEIGLDVEQFNSCLESEKYNDRIEALRNDATAIGGKGTPYTLITDSEGKIITTIPGAQPYENVKVVLDQILDNSN